MTRSEDTRERILRTAEDLFARRGYDATGVAEICAQAGLSKGAFYHHFPSKQAVFLALLQQWLAGLDVELERARAGAPSVPEQLQRMAGVAGQVLRAGSGQLPLFLEFWTQAAHDPSVWAATIEPYHRYRAYFADLIRAGIAEGSLEGLEPVAAAQILLSLALGLVLQGLLDPQGADWGGVARQGMAAFLRGLARGEG